MFHDHEEATFCFSTVHVDVRKVDFTSFSDFDQVRSETLRQDGFAGSDLTSYDYALTCGERGLKAEPEELCEEAHLIITMREPAGEVFQREGRLILEDCGLSERVLHNVRSQLNERPTLGMA